MNEQINSQQKVSEWAADIKDVFFHLISKWHIILIVCVLALAAGSGMSVLQSKLAEPYDPTLPGFEQDMLAINGLNDAYTQYVETVENNKRHYLLSLDPQAEYYEGEIRYVLSSESIQDFRIFMQMINFSMEDATWQDLAEAISFDGYVPSLKDVITATYVVEDISQVTGSTVFFLETPAQFGTVTFSISCMTEENYVTLANLLEQKLQAAVLAQPEGSQVKLQQAYAGKDVIASGEVMARINKLADNEAELYKVFATLSQTIRDDKLKQYDSPENLIAYYYVHYRPEVESRSLVRRSALYIPNPLKLGILLAVLAGIGAIAVIVLLYLFSGKVHTVTELNSLYHLPITGYLVAPGSKKSGWIKRLTSKDKLAVSSSAEYIGTVLNHAAQDELVICEPSPAASQDELNTILNQCGKKASVGDLCKDAAFYSTAMENGSVYLHVALEQTSKADVDHLLSKCRDFGLSVCGILVTEKL